MNYPMHDIKLVIVSGEIMCMVYRVRSTTIIEICHQLEGIEHEPKAMS